MQSRIQNIFYKRISSSRNLILYSIVLLVLACSSSFAKNDAHKDDSQALTKKLDQFLTEYYQNRNVASISAGVLHHGKIIWLGARGYADIGNKVPAKTNTLYRIASISKVITAVAVMQLVEKGKVKLDDDARKYVPYFPKKKWRFTVRQILQHTAGLRTYKTGEFNSTIDYPSIHDAVDVLSRDSLEYKPGTKYLYSTLGYNLLAAIIENVSGLSFNQYLTRNIFIPCGMSSTHLDIHKEIFPNRAKGYQKNLYRNFENAPLCDLSIKFAGGGIISNTEDVLKFASSLMSAKLIKQSTLDSMLVPTRLSNGKILDTGLGFDLKYDKDNKFFYGHYGHGTGFLSLLAIYPKDSTAAVHLVNTVDRNVDNPAIDLATISMGLNYDFPKKSLADKMMETTLQSNIDSAINHLKALQKDSSTVYDFSANEFNTFGYDLLKINKHEEAIKWFKVFCTEYPENISAYIGLGDAYNHDNNTGLALKAYRKVLAIDGSNNYAFKMIKKLERQN